MPLPDEFLTVKEVTQLLKLSESKVYRMLQQGVLPGKKIGSSWRIERRELEEYLNNSSNQRRKING